MDRRIELVISKIENETSTAWDTATLASWSISLLRAFAISSNRKRGRVRLNTSRNFVCEKRRRCCARRFLSVKQILKQVGIGSNSHFVHDFRKKHGMTPTAYRRAIWTRTRKQRSDAKTEVVSHFRQNLAVFDKKQLLTTAWIRLDCRSPHQTSITHTNGVD